MQKSPSFYLETAALVLFGILFLAFPLALSTLTTDSFAIPKQALLGGVVLISLILFGAKMITDGKVSIRLTPFNVPISLLTIFILISALLSVNKYDALISSAPLLFAIVAYFILVNIAKTQQALFFLQSALTVGASLVALNAILSFFKVYLLPFEFTRSQSFTPLGTLLDQGLYLIFILPLAIYFAAPLFKAKDLRDIQLKSVGYLIASVLILLGLSITVYEVAFLKLGGGLRLLPFVTGFQTAFAAISQDAGRVVQGFLFGSGFGTYAVDFTRFKQPAFNAYQDLWNLTFFRSSSFVLELLATTGFLGVTAFLLLLSKLFRNNSGTSTRRNPFFMSLVIGSIAAFLLPFSFTIYALFFLILGLFSAVQVLHDPKRFFDVKLQFVALKEGLVSMFESPLGTASNAASHDEKIGIKFLPITFLLFFVLLAGVVGYFSTTYVLSDLTMQQSLVAASEKNGSKTYELQSQAIAQFPYKDSYRRVFSQVNLQLANSLASSTPKGASPSAQTQTTIVNLIQQSIQEGRNAVGLAPQTSSNWQNLAGIYRGLIGVGQNAENFAVAASQQAAQLDPNNPNSYLALGGIYYQLKLWDEAQRQFQVAVSLKPDLANAHYNLGHALENKGDLQNALAQYQAVRQLVTNAKDEKAVKQIDEEIKTLQGKIGSAEQNAQQNAQTQTPQQQQTGSAVNQPPLALPTPAAQLPAQQQPIDLPPPPASPSATNQ